MSPLTEFLYVETRKFHPDHDTAYDRKSFRIQWDIAGHRALGETPRNAAELVMEVGRMHRAWNGPWCIPSPRDTTDGQVFVIDEPHQLYRCVVCGTAWNIATVVPNG